MHHSVVIYIKSSILKCYWYCWWFVPLVGCEFSHGRMVWFLIIY